MGMALQSDEQKLQSDGLAVQGDERTLLYGRHIIVYDLLYCDRKTMEIAVHPDKSVVVKAPMTAENGLIEKKIRKRARWILSQMQYFSQFHPGTPRRCYVHGETHRYLGKHYRLQVSEGSENAVKLVRGFFHVTCRGGASPEKVQKLLQKWYLEKAQAHFKESVDRCWQKVRHLGGAKPTLSIKRMQKRWGSLSEKGTMTLNTNLICASKDCIDYVVSHELCHLKYKHHGPDFYALLDALLPDREKIKQKLERSMA